MRTYILAIATAALFAIPTAAFSEDITIGPGGVRIGPSYGHHRLYNREGRRLRRIAAGLPSQGTARRAGHGQLPEIPHSVPLVQEANSGTPGEIARGSFLFSYHSVQTETRDRPVHGAPKGLIRCQHRCDRADDKVNKD